jgi:RimJ/RimL family protein N-acetyltransferase
VYWGRGYAVDGVREMMEFVELTYPVRRFIIEMDTRNRALLVMSFNFNESLKMFE